MFNFINPFRFFKNLLSLNLHLDRTIPAKILDKNLIIGTWNIRNFDETSRIDESYGYISAVISRFDIIAIQELKVSLDPLERLKEHLGPHWQYLVSHPCANQKGNYERMAFMYDTRRVDFSGVSSVIGHFGNTATLNDFSRAPFMAGFSVSDFKFFLCNVHLYYDRGRLKSEFRRQEIQNLLQSFDVKTCKNKYGFTDNYIVLGDFNVPNKESSSYKEMLSHGFEGYDELLEAQRPKQFLYDQILFKSNTDYFSKACCGSFSVFDYVYTDAQECYYKDEVAKTRMSYRQWRTYQISDHDPKWLQLKIDINYNYWLKKLESSLSPTQRQQAQSYKQFAQNNLAFSHLAKTLSDSHLDDRNQELSKMNTSTSLGQGKKEKLR